MMRWPAAEIDWLARSPPCRDPAWPADGESVFVFGESATRFRYGSQPSRAATFAHRASIRKIPTGKRNAVSPGSKQLEEREQRALLIVGQGAHATRGGRIVSGSLIVEAEALEHVAQIRR